jgi:hypothetical protein
MEDRHTAHENRSPQSELWLGTVAAAPEPREFAVVALLGKGIQT